MQMQMWELWGDVDVWGDMGRCGEMRLLELEAFGDLWREAGDEVGADEGGGHHA